MKNLVVTKTTVFVTEGESMTERLKCEECGNRFLGEFGEDSLCPRCQAALEVKNLEEWLSL